MDDDDDIDEDDDDDDCSIPPQGVPILGNPASEGTNACTISFREFPHISVAAKVNCLGINGR